MKKLFLSMAIIAITAVSFNNVQAQENRLLIGAGASYATDIDNIGLFVKGIYRITPQWEAEASYTYFFENDNWNWSVLDLNAHYVFYNYEGIDFYGLAGANITFLNFNHDVPGVDNTSSDEGLNLGGGARFGLSDNLSFNPELKYTLFGDIDYLTLSVGLLYHF